MTPCPRAGRWIGGCRFEARYDSHTPPDVKKLPPLMSGDVKDLVAVSTYVRDVCTRCGATIERTRGND